MLKITYVYFLTANLVSVGKNNAINKNCNSKIIRVRYGAIIAKSQSGNLVKSQLSAQSSRAGFFTPKARLAFNKLRQRLK